MASTAAGRRVSALRFGGAPWSAQAWRNTTFVTAGLPVHVAALVIFAVPWVNLGLFAPVRFKAVMLALLISIAAPLCAAPALSVAQRSRFWSVLGVDIPRAPRIGGRFTWRGVAARARSGSYWRQVGYHLVVGPILAAGALLTMTIWATGLAMIAAGALHKAFPPSSALRLQVHKGVLALLVVAGLVLLLAAPRVAAAVVRLDTRAANALLGPSRSEELERRVESLAESRAGVVDAADAERRRIERDLHDGAQQRLVSLAMSLGLARENLIDLPDDARRVIVDAHEEAKGALAELRNLVRGLHPAILEDRGLDAALSGIAARMPIPVRLRVDVPERASPTVEAVAYFIVSEALANIVRHSRASGADVDVERLGDVLRLVVRDDGVGGADPSRGTGLSGLVQRAGSVDGTLRIGSPAGGPTTIEAVLPCAS